MANRDWRHEAASPDLKFQNLLTRDCGAPAFNYGGVHNGTACHMIVWSTVLT
jgi:hypothetical protein